jgi:hypothetical protein
MLWQFFYWITLINFQISRRIKAKNFAAPGNFSRLSQLARLDSLLISPFAFRITFRKDVLRYASFDIRVVSPSQTFKFVPEWSNWWPENIRFFRYRAVFKPENKSDKLRSTNHV